MMPDDIQITRFSFLHAHSFVKLRKEIENKTDFLLAKKGERKENALHVVARLLISQRRTITFLAWDEKSIIGYVSLVFPKFKKLRGNAYLTIAVKEEYRGKGIGTLLMDTGERYAKDRGVRRIELEVFGKNEVAIKLYEKRGYVIEGVKKNAISEEEGFDDIIIMTKRVDSAATV